MGKAMVIFKVFPESPEEVDSVEERLKGLSGFEVREIRKEPLAFGMSTFKVAIVVPDKEEGAMPKAEKALTDLKGVGQVEVEGTTLL